MRRPLEQRDPSTKPRDEVMFSSLGEHIAYKFEQVIRHAFGLPVSRTARETENPAVRFSSYRDVMQNIGLEIFSYGRAPHNVVAYPSYHMPGEGDDFTFPQFAFVWEPIVGNTYLRNTLELEVGAGYFLISLRFVADHHENFHLDRAEVWHGHESMVLATDSRSDSAPLYEAIKAARLAVLSINDNDGGAEEYLRAAITRIKDAANTDRNPSPAKVTDAVPAPNFG